MEQGLSARPRPQAATAIAGGELFERSFAHPLKDALLEILSKGCSSQEVEFFLWKTVEKVGRRRGRPPWFRETSGTSRLSPSSPVFSKTGAPGGTATHPCEERKDGAP